MNADSFDLPALLNGEPYHIGIVVDDVDEAMAEYGALFGMQWGQRMRSSVSVEFDGSLRDLPMDAVYSRSGPVRVELVKEQPGTVWAAGSGVHHIGFWCDDVAASAAALEAAGYARAVTLHLIAGTDLIVTMHHGPRGLYVELVPTAVREFMEAMWA